MTNDNDPLAGIQPVDHSNDLPALRRLLDVPQAKAEYLRTVGRFDGINHWGDLLECSALLEQIQWERQQYNALRARVERLRRAFLLEVPNVNDAERKHLEPGDLE